VRSSSPHPYSPLSPGRERKSSLTAEVAEEVGVWSYGLNPKFAARLFSALSAAERVSPLPRMAKSQQERPGGCAWKPYSYTILRQR